jgi:hypothetical protein
VSQHPYVVAGQDVDPDLLSCWRCGSKASGIPGGVVVDPENGHGRGSTSVDRRHPGQIQQRYP